MPISCREMILSNYYYDLITDIPVGLLGRDTENKCVIEFEDLYDLIYFEREAPADIQEYFFSYRSVPKLYGLMQEGGSIGGFDPNSLIASGIAQVQREPLSLTGRGAVICFIDTGIDYTSPVFRKEDGSSRILAIWDQTIQTGKPPEGFLYGTEYTREEINRALQSEDPYSIVPSRDEIGHGSSLASAAAGSRLDGGYTFQGAAPEADIVVVKLKECKTYLRDFYLIPRDVPAYQENDIMLAVEYADSFTEPLIRPVVICLGMGTNNGDHTGSSPLGRYLNLIAARRSRAVVVAGGNEGNAAHHFRGELNNRGGSGENSRAVEVRAERGAEGFFLELWGSLPDIFTISVRTPGGETIPPVRLGIRDSITYSFIYERSRVTIAGLLVEPASGEELIVLRVQAPTPGIWTFRVEAAGDIHNGEFNIWLPITQFLTAPVYFLESSPYITLTEPAMASGVIGVSTYDAANNSFYITSGRGYSRCGTIRPDFAAPGVNVSTINGRESESSLAAAITAGAVAQFMQWAVVEGNNAVVASREIKNYFIRGASRSFDVTYPNREWGYGRLNMVGTFDALIGV
ncbi:MAG: S8 family peptidase [Roseburia sp.]|nr:S8 family peptidase [Roseburia sp.]MCM1099039.1 S8 family peptidase [Ruminococcus flavefaciens]